MTQHLSQILASNESGGLSVAWDFLHKGGIFMIPLGITSIVGMMAIVYKFLSLSSSRIIPAALALEVSQIPQPIAEAHAVTLLRKWEGGPSTLDRLATVALKHRGKSRSEITHAVESSAREEVLYLHSGISILDTIITIAPLLGLLGTASGLVQIFQGLGDNSDHLAIARGISEALTTTIFGLAIAVPCVIAHGYFIRRIEMLTARMESLLSHLSTAFEKTNTNA